MAKNSVAENNVTRNPYLAEHQPRQKVQCGSRSSNNRNNQIAARKRLRAERKRRLLIRRVVFVLIQILVLGITIAFLVKVFQRGSEQESFSSRQSAEMMVSLESGSTMEKQIQGLSISDYGRHPTWTEDFLTLNEYSRPGAALTEVNSVFVHYTANPGTSAVQNRSYFEQQKDTHERSVSAHFIIGYEGEIIQCVPLDEIAYAVQTRNEDSISIECCYVAEDGSFTQETYDSLIKLLQWLVMVYDLDVDEDVLRHYDCGGKKCPIYYTENEDAWKQLKEDVKK